jgi:hypothetical protein
VTPAEHPELTALLSSPHARYYGVEPERPALPTEPRPGMSLADAFTVDRRQRQASFRTARAFNDYGADGQSPLGSQTTFLLLQSTPSDRGLTLLARAGVHHVSTWLSMPLPRRTVELQGARPQHVYALPQKRAYVSAYADWRPHRFGVDDLGQLQAFLTDPGRFGVAALYGDELPAPVATATTCQAAAQVVLQETGDQDRIAAEVSAPCPVAVCGAGELWAGLAGHGGRRPRPALRGRGGVRGHLRAPPGATRWASPTPPASPAGSR